MNNKQKKVEIERHGPISARYGGNKTPVLTLINRDTGEAYSKVMNDVNSETIRDAIAEATTHHGTIDLHTDGGKAYGWVSNEVRSHEKADHSNGEYVNENGAGTNPVESFFAQLKRTIDGTHHHVSRTHLQRYLNEFGFRHTTRQMKDVERLATYYLGLFGKRLTYRPVQQRTRSLIE